GPDNCLRLLAGQTVGGPSCGMIRRESYRRRCKRPDRIDGVVVVFQIHSMRRLIAQELRQVCKIATDGEVTQIFAVGAQIASATLQNRQSKREPKESQERSFQERLTS